MNVRTILWGLVALFFCGFVQGQSFFLKDITIHVGNGQVIENGAVVVENGKIIFSGKEKEINTTLPEAIIDGKSAHLYPGIISLYTNIGLSEIDYVRASNDHTEVGDFNAHVRAGIAYNVDSDVIPTLRSNGILVAQVTPRGSLVAGMSSVMYLNGWTWEEALVKADEGIHLNWPTQYAYGWQNESEFSAQRSKNIEKLNSLFESAKSYCLQPTPQTNLRLQSMCGLFTGQTTLYLAANHSKDVMEAVLFAEKYSVKKMAIVGAKNALSISEELKKRDIPVILNRLHDTPTKAEDDYDYSYKLPAQYWQKGVKVAHSYYGDMEVANSRNLAFSAGTSAAFGLEKEAALTAVTLTPAQILGIDHRLGTIEKGKEATFVLSTGDIFDMKDSRVIQAFIKGVACDLDDKQKALNRKYKNKYKIN